ncbi:MAG: hypothetical protein ACLFQS_09760 [Bacteroidales bacterium]
MMKRIVTFLLVLFLANQLVAQVRPARKKEFKKFYESTTYIVKDKDPFTKFNEKMRAAIENHWTLTPVEFITYDEFHRKRTNENYSFMILANIKQNNMDEVYEFINFVMGNKKRDFERMPDLGSVPLCYREANPHNYYYKIGGFVKFMQTYAKEETTTDRLKLSKFLKMRDDQLKSMELWLLESEVAPGINTLEKIQKVYPYTVKFVTKDEIENAIDQDMENVAFLHKIGPEDTIEYFYGKRCWKFILSAKDGKVLYSSFHEIDRDNPDAFLASDLEEIKK